MTEAQEQMDAAAVVAAKELEILFEGTASEERQAGMAAVLEWLTAHKNTAGYKRLGKVMVAAYRRLDEEAGG